MKRSEDNNFRKEKSRERLIYLSISRQKLQGLKLEDKFRKCKERGKMTEVAHSCHLMTKFASLEVRKSSRFSAQIKN